jgi:hypothetical protein
MTSSLAVPVADSMRFGRALTAEELAAVLNVSSKLIFKKAKTGRIPSASVLASGLTLTPLKITRIFMSMGGPQANVNSVACWLRRQLIRDDFFPEEGLSFELYGQDRLTSWERCP